MAAEHQAKFDLNAQAAADLAAQLATAHADSASSQARLDDLQSQHAAAQEELVATQSIISDLQQSLQEVTCAKVRLSQNMRVIVAACPFVPHLRPHCLAVACGWVCDWCTSNANGLMQYPGIWAN